MLYTWNKVQAKQGFNTRLREEANIFAVNTIDDYINVSIHASVRRRTFAFKRCSIPDSSFQYTPP